MKNNYSDKLRDPRWQKKRLEVLQRDDFTCKLCGDTTTELQIHHKSYEYGKEPYEYELENFVSLCKVCHLVVESIRKEDRHKIIGIRKKIFESNKDEVAVFVRTQNSIIFFKFSDNKIEYLLSIGEIAISLVNDLMNIHKPEVLL